MTFLVRAHAPREPMHRDQLPTPCRRHVRVDGLQRPSGRTATSPSGNPITIMSPTPVATPESRTEISMGTRAHTTPIAPARRLSSAPRSALRAALRVTERRRWHSITTRWPEDPATSDNFSP